VERCAVVLAPSDGVLTVTAAKPAAGVVELSGSSGTFHMQVGVKRTS
jgi:hypothetical protein